MPSCWVLSSTKTERIITVPGSPGTDCPLQPRFSRLSQLQPSISSKDLVPNLPASHTARDCTALGSFDVRSRETSHRPACMRLASIPSLFGKELCSSALTAATRTNALAQWSSRIDTAKAFKAVVERPRKVAAFAAGEQSQGLSPSRRADSKEEPFLAATQRLDSLLSGVGCVIRQSCSSRLHEHARLRGGDQNGCFQRLVGFRMTYSSTGTAQRSWQNSF